MPKYLVSANYTADGLQELMQDSASGRQRVLREVVANYGGKLESMHYGIGGSDVYVIAMFPDNPSAVAMSIAAMASGLVTVKTTPLLTIDEMDEALSMAVTDEDSGDDTDDES